MARTICFHLDECCDPAIADALRRRDISQRPTGYTPQQLQTAYGLNQISFSGIKGDGTGQTITLVVAYDNPSFANSTDPNFDTSALHLFDQQFGLLDPPSFIKANQAEDKGDIPIARR